MKVLFVLHPIELLGTWVLEVDFVVKVALLAEEPEFLELVVLRALLLACLVTE